MLATAGPILLVTPAIFAVHVMLQLATWQIFLLTGLEVLVGLGLYGHDVSLARLAIAIVGATIFGILVRKFLLRIEWELASGSVLATLTEADSSATPEKLIEQAVTLLRDFTRADAAVALRQVDAVTAEALVLLPADALPDKLTTPKLFELALTKNCCLYYPDYASLPNAAPVLVAKTQSLAVLPLSGTSTYVGLENSSEKAPSEVVKSYGGAILLIWYHKTDIPLYLRRFIESLLGELRTLLRFQQATFSLDELRVRYRAILQTIPQGVIFVDESGDQGWINQSAAEQLGLRQGAVEPHLISQAMAKLRMSASNQEAIVAQAAQFFAQPQAEIRDWCWVFNSDQPKVLSISSTSTRLRDVPGRLWLLNDITEKYFTQQALKERTAQLEVINKELEAFSYSVSHDLRAPLRRIDGFSEILLRDYISELDAQGKNYFQRIRVATKKMGQLIDDTLQLARVSKSEMRRQSVDLSVLASAIAQDLQQAQPERQVEFVIAPNLVANADPNLIQIVLENLLSNAWKYTGKHQSACIEFGVTQHDGTVAYFVRDDGAGFDMAYADKLFTAFQRLHGSTEFEGTGIGLATVQRIIHRHSGRIWVAAAVEQGATFYFTI